MKFDVLQGEMAANVTPSGYTFSAVPLGNLGASAFTLVTLVFDVSGSTSHFTKEMEEAGAEIIKACKKSPRAENLLVRAIRFGTDVEEIFGFKLLDTVPDHAFDGELGESGQTALYRATLESLEATIVYGESLMAQTILANAVVFVITDGKQYPPERHIKPEDIKAATTAAVTEEKLESLTTVLVSINNDPEVKEFGTRAGFSQVVEIGAANAKTLAKLAKFVSQSISSASTSLGSGGPSVPVAPGQFGLN